jgi:hypothetical protein
MRVTNCNVLASCPKDELHQWFIGLYAYYPCRCPPIHESFAATGFGQDGQEWRGTPWHPIVSNEAVARVFKRLADRLQGAVTDTSMMIITPEFSAHFLEVYVKKAEGARFTGDRIRFLMLSLPLAVLDLLALRYEFACSFYMS